MNHFEFWHKWLVALSAVIVLLGLMIAFLYGTALFKPLDDQITAAFWDHRSEITGAMRDYQRWTIGLLGAVMASWGVLMAFIALYPFKRKEKWAWDCLAAALVTWFVVDESFSLYYGVYANAVGNLILLLGLALPLAFTRRHFVQA
jgi:uncharacterized BrkB/YihY/UPF0761 family membrane protein